jgi:superfamily II DNA/RNA helicase
MPDDEEHSSTDEAESTSSVVEGDAETSFARPSFALSRQLVANLERRGLAVPTEVQTQVIPRIRDSRGKDLCVNAPTGSGKTLAYALPITEVRFAAKRVLMVGSGKETVYRARMCCRRSHA